MRQNILVQASKVLLIDFIGEILYFPIWWYGPGLKKTIIYFFNTVRNNNSNLALGLLIRSLFKPMFGVEDRSGRIISFFMRLLLVISRAIVFLLFILLNLLLLIFWIALPLIAVWGIMINFSAIWTQ